MIDVRKKAEARAAAENKPIGASLETERQREKQAVFRQVENLDGSNIHSWMNYICFSICSGMMKSRHTDNVLK